VLKAVITLVSGAGLSQLLAILALPVIARYYDAASYGVFSLYLVLVSIAGIALTLQLNQAIVIAKSSLEARKIVCLCLWICLIACFSLFSLLYFLTHIISIVPEGTLGFSLQLLFAGSFLVAATSAFHYYCIRIQYFRLIALCLSVRTILMVGLQIGFATSLPTFKSLILAHILAEIVVIFLYIYATPEVIRSLRYRSFDRELSLYKNIAHRYSGFIRYTFPQETMNAFSQGVPIIILSLFYPAAAGYFAMAHKILNAPTGLIANSVRQVAFSRMAEIKRSRGRIRDFYFRVIAILASVACTGLLAYYMFSEIIFGQLFNAEWTPSLSYMNLLILWMIFLVLNPPSLAYLKVKRKLSFLLKYDILLLLSRSAALLLGCVYFGPIYAVSFFVAVSVFFNAFVVIYATRLVMEEPVA